MSFSYDLSEDVGRVRLLISDTVSADAKFSDEEIDYFLEAEGSVNSAAAAACESLASKFALTTRSETIGDYSINTGQQAAQWIDLAKKFREKESQGAAFAVSDDVETSFHCVE